MDESLVNLLRNERLVQVETYTAREGMLELLVASVRRKWAALREQLLAGDYPVTIVTRENVVTVIYRWKGEKEKSTYLTSALRTTLESELASLCLSQTTEPDYSEILRGFNLNFPKLGGTELLRGVCSCVLNITGLVRDHLLSVKNGIVLMHRSPQADQDKDGRNEMYLKILMHGGDMTIDRIGDIRVEQNFKRPNDGIVRSNGEGGKDFPATAVWRVAWRIITPLGAVLTDPKKPLVFGPTTVYHYPPVGTKFISSTGPVALIHETTKLKVGTLTPGELTAFDIVVTKDDEVEAKILNKAPDDIFKYLTSRS